MLDSFEEEAIQNTEPSDDDYLESQRVNRLIDILSRVLALVGDSNCTYNVFSDNLCLRFTYEDSPNTLVEVLILISHLMKEFVKEGYFIRGGVAIGWCLDYKDIVIGTPLVRAYRHESYSANYPRVVIDSQYVEILNAYLDSGEIGEEYIDASSGYIKEKDELFYINNFYYINNFEDNESKIDFLQTYSYQIGQNLMAYKKNNIKVHSKYNLLAQDFNAFVDEVISDSSNQEQPFSPQQIQHLSTIKLRIR